MLIKSKHIDDCELLDWARHHLQIFTDAEFCRQVKTDELEHLIEDGSIQIIP